MHFIFAIVSLSAEHKMSTCFTRNVLAGCILHEQMISFIRESNDSPSKFLHPRTCVTEEILTWPRNRDISRDSQKQVRHRSREEPVRHEFQLPPFWIALVLLPATRRTDLELVISIFYRKCLMCVPIYVLTIFEIHFNLVKLRYLWSDIWLFRLLLNQCRWNEKETFLIAL